VPDVTRQAYVFAKGMLADGGFAWRVRGPVGGYAANLVAAQDPAPGTRVVDNGAPTIVLRLERNPGYGERGLPENAAPYAGSAAVPAAEAAEAAASSAAPAPAGTTAAAGGARAGGAKRNEAKKPVRSKKPAAAPSPAFAVPGAPPEPRGAMPLPLRAKLLERRLATQPRATPALVRYWLYQHSWIVAGAKFGWSGGADALRTLLAVDRGLQARWGIGAKSAAVARAALAEVERRSRS
jgi:hypothetical protein